MSCMKIYWHLTVKSLFFWKLVKHVSNAGFCYVMWQCSLLTLCSKGIGRFCPIIVRRQGGMCTRPGGSRVVPEHPEASSCLPVRESSVPLLEATLLLWSPSMRWVITPKSHCSVRRSRYCIMNQTQASALLLIPKLNEWLIYFCLAVI